MLRPLYLDERGHTSPTYRKQFILQPQTSLVIAFYIFYGKSTLVSKSNPHICKINSLSSVELVHLFLGLLQHPGGREIILEHAGELRSKEKCGLSCSLRRFSPFSTNGKVSVNLEWINTGVKTTLSFLLRRASFFENISIYGSDSI